MTVSGSASGTAAVYADGTWALPNAALPNGNATYNVTASDGQGHQAGASVSVNLPATVSYTYDANGNLLSDGNRGFAYDDENQLVSVWVTNRLAAAISSMTAGCAGGCGSSPPGTGAPG